MGKGYAKMTITIIGFTGTRKGMSDNQSRHFSQIIYNLMFKPFTTLKMGDCIGADLQASKIYVEIMEGAFLDIHPPTNPQYRAWIGIKQLLRGEHSLKEVKIFKEKPYGVRDKDIVDECTLLLAAPLDENKEELRSGTWQTVRYARKIKKPYILLPR